MGVIDIQPALPVAEPLRVPGRQEHPVVHAGIEHLGFQGHVPENRVVQQGRGKLDMLRLPPAQPHFHVGKVHLPFLLRCYYIYNIIIIILFRHADPHSQNPVSRGRGRGRKGCDETEADAGEEKDRAAHQQYGEGAAKGTPRPPACVGASCAPEGNRQQKNVMLRNSHSMPIRASPSLLAEISPLSWQIIYLPG